jgi:TonB-dependent receptor
MTPAPRSGRFRFLVPILLATTFHAATADAQEAVAPAALAEPADAKPKEPARKQEEASAPADSAVEEILVSGSSVTDAVDQARFSESIVDVLSAEDFSTTGDSGVVDALSRVTGVTTVGDKYVYVRGLGERYSATLFNNASLPSPDPVRRVVPLDIFPSGVMEQLSVQKTYAPYLPADFAGGSVQLTTKAIPAERVFHFDVSTKANTRTTFKRTPWFEGGGADWTGFDNGFRDLPSNVRDLDTAGAVTPEDRQAAGLAVDRSWNTSDDTLPPGLEMSGTYANRWDTGIGDIGLVMGAEGSNDWHYVKEGRATASGDPTAPVTESSTLKRTTNSIDYAGLGSLNWSPATSQQVKATLFWSHNTDKRYLEEDPIESLAGNNDFPYRRSIRAEWEEQSLLTTQLSGSHEVSALADLLVDWGVTWSQAKRDLPDARFYGFTYQDDDASDGLDPNAPAKLSPAASNTREWEYLTDEAWDAVLNTSLPLKLTDSVTTTLRAGAKYFYKQRESEALRFRYLTTRPRTEYDSLPIEEIWADENIRPDFWNLNQFTRATDQYDAEEEVIAGYLHTESAIGDHLRLSVGSRYESATQETVTGGTVDPVTKLEKAAFFPAVEVTWLVRDDVQMRAAWSKTLNRPDLRELSEAIFINPENRFSYIGNRNLQPAELMNYDLRLEWYHGTGDSLEVAGFYKDISDPIQEIALPQGNFRTWRNGEEAWLWGVEFAAQQSLMPLGRWADDFTVRTNAAYIDSEVSESADAPITNRKHPLQGQSEWVFNFQVTHDYLPWDLKNTLAFNMFGERLSDVGAKPPNATSGGREDAYAQPVATLDYVLKWGFEAFDQDMSLTFKAKNLLDPKTEVTRSGVAERTYREGRFFSLELGYDF